MSNPAEALLHPTGDPHLDGKIIEGVMGDPAAVVLEVMSALTPEKVQSFLNEGVVYQDGKYVISNSLAADLREKVSLLGHYRDGTVDALVIIALGAFAKERGMLLDLTH